MSAIEAIQAKLEGYGVILVPGSRPPDEITDLDIRQGNYRRFDEPNAGGPVYTYRRDHYRRLWAVVAVEAA